MIWGVHGLFDFYAVLGGISVKGNYLMTLVDYLGERANGELCIDPSVARWDI